MSWPVCATVVAVVLTVCGFEIAHAHIGLSEHCSTALTLHFGILNVTAINMTNFNILCMFPLNLVNHLLLCRRLCVSLFVVVRSYPSEVTTLSSINKPIL